MHGELMFKSSILQNSNNCLNFLFATGLSANGRIPIFQHENMGTPCFFMY